ncbi:MAG: NF038122 family metalloprotease [Calothrix sp. MO_167.B42]|nr:NF038122 family metalloprotease [Calothrix sp. MO_167.B42]
MQKTDKPSTSGYKLKLKYQYLVAPLTLATTLILGSNLPAAALKINLTYGASVTEEQKEAAELAALIWEHYITDDITVNIHMDMSELRWGKMGTAIPNLRNNINYDQFRIAAEEEAKLAGQNTYFLPTAINPEYSLASGYKAIYKDVNRTTLEANYSEMLITSANAKALGFNFDSRSVLHGYIQLNSRYNWSYKYAQGTVDKNKFDFTSVVIHEIGHNLGFISGIDSIVGDAKPSTLDMFRCSDYSAKLGTIDFSVDSHRRYFSIDGCQTVFNLTETEQTTNKKGNIIDQTMTYEALFARGLNTRLGGDGVQASHWTDQNPDTGIMNPLLSTNTIRRITGVDLTAMDYIGYDVDLKKYYKTDDNGDYILDSKGNKIVKQLDLASLQSQAVKQAGGDNYRPEYSPDGDNGNETEVETFMYESGIYYSWWGGGEECDPSDPDYPDCTFW